MKPMKEFKLQPKEIWDYFFEISKVPRTSGHEDKLRNWIKEWANNHGILIKEDNIGNLLLVRNASTKCKNFPTIIVQCHLDMVGSKLPNKNFNFLEDSLELQTDGTIVTANGTSLGADNGIGIAFCLALLTEKNIETGRIEVILTVEEETGLKGAMALEPNFFSGKYLINLDGEELGKIVIGSAGAEYTDFTYDLKRRDQKVFNFIEISVSGLAGGHSGLDIHLNRLNAIKLLIELYNEMNFKLHDISIQSINGGDATNSIPSTGIMTFAVNTKNNLDKIKNELLNSIKKIKNKYYNIEPNLDITVNDIVLTNTEAEGVLDHKLRNDLISLLDSIPHGVISYNKELDGLVQTSNNLAMIRTEERQIEIFCTSRSSVDQELEDLSIKLSNLGKKYNAEINQHSRYPGWAANPKSRFSNYIKTIYESILNKKVEFKAVHAGLECGIFKGLDPEIEIVSIGPQITNAHSPDETVNIRSVDIIWQVVKKIVTSINNLTE